MKVVVDTNVVAYLLLGTERFVVESRRFMAGVRHGLAPALWEAELANVVWMAIQQGVIRPEEGPKRLALAAQLGIHSVPSRTLWQGGTYPRCWRRRCGLRYALRRVGSP